MVHIDDKPNKPAVIKQDPLPRKSSLKASAGQTKADAGVVGNEEHTGNLSIKAGENTEQFSEGHVVVDEVSRFENKATCPMTDYFRPVIPRQHLLVEDVVQAAREAQSNPMLLKTI